MSNATQLTTQEIEQYREQFKDYPEALDALELIAETDGDLIESAGLLAMETGVEISSRVVEEDNILDKLAKRCRSIVCDDDFIDDLMKDLLTVAVATLAASGQIPVAVATPVVIYLAKKGVKKWCQSNE
ncbi:hypothetical protein [Gloeothece verrucosa]|uniref:Uncharacterized protein n=1 Tax=Gloeothece verrucosa (strain PCC 7822) TaxID=497965 RepID=E0UD84_GLOV7|nr:hypothetical protein [Gloeothece verrucosa]ADN12964.1 conserved hypothetical protein [Gloeothece verrucosa PCC 7822]